MRITQKDGYLQMHADKYALANCRVYWEINHFKESLEPGKCIIWKGKFNYENKN